MKQVDEAKQEVQSAKKVRIRMASVLVLLMIGAVLVCGGLSIYWLYANDDVLDVKNAPFPVQTIEQNGEEILLLKVDYCKNTNTTGDVRVSFVSTSAEIFLPMSKEKQPRACVNTDLPIVVPKNLPPDEYHIHFRATYQVNPFKTVVSQFDSVTFKVGK